MLSYPYNLVIKDEVAGKLSIIGKVLVCNQPGFIPCTPYGFLIPTSSDLKCRTRKE